MNFVRIQDRLRKLLVATAIAVCVVEPSVADARKTSARPPAAALLPGAEKVLGISRVEDAGAALEQAFTDPIEITLTSGSEISRQTPPHCRALLELEPRIANTEPAGDWNVLQQRLADCHALQWLGRVAAPSRTALPHDLPAVRQTRLWPASIWPAVSQEEAAALSRPGQTLHGASRRHSWQVIRADARSPGALRLETDHYTVRVQWLARGDFDGDGWEDWLLRWQAQAAGGSWRAARSLLITRQAPGRALSAK